MHKQKEFDFLEKEYGLRYSCQKFKNCFGGYWLVYTHSYYNDNGCFTIHILPQREEIDFFFAKNYSDIREKLCEKEIDFKSIGQEMGKEIEQKILTSNNQDLLNILADAIKMKIEKDGEFFGIIVKK